MSVKWGIGIVGAVIVVVGLVFLFLPIRVWHPPLHSMESCGSVLYQDETAKVNRESVRMPGHEMLNRACETALHTRKIWAWPVVAVGGITLLGAAVVRGPNRQNAP
jgi:hypothetical protein